MVNNTIQWRPVIIGIIIASILEFISLMSSQLINPAFLLAGIAVGYMIGGTAKSGAINGVIMGVIGGIISIVMLLIVYSSAIAQYGSVILEYLAGTLITIFIVELVLAAVGGVLGFFIKAELDKKSVQAVEE